MIRLGGLFQRVSYREVAKSNSELIVRQYLRENLDLKADRNTDRHLKEELTYRRKKEKIDMEDNS